MSRSLPHLTLTTSTSSLPFTSPIFPTTSPTHTRPSVHDEYFPCDGPRQGGRSTQIPSLTGYEPKLIEPEDLEPRRIELDRNLGTDPYQVQERFMRDNFQNSSLKIWRDLEKLVSICPMSNHRCIPIMTQRRALQTRILKMENYEKVLASPLYAMQGNSSRIPTAPGKLSAIIQEREVSAKRTQADRREKLDVKFRNREHRGNLLQCLHREAQNREINSRVPFSKTLTRQMWEDLFLKALKIICSAKRDQTWRSKNFKLNLSIIDQPASATSLCSKIGITGRTTWICWISTRTSASTRRIIYERESSLRYSIPKYVRNGRN